MRHCDPPKGNGLRPQKNRTLDEDRQWQLLAAVVQSHLFPLLSTVQLVQLAGNHARRAETPLTRSIPGSTFSVHVCTLRGCSDKLRENWTKPIRTEGIQSLELPRTPLVESASRYTAQDFLQARASSIVGLSLVVPLICKSAFLVRFDLGHALSAVFCP